MTDTTRPRNTQMPVTLFNWSADRLPHVGEQFKSRVTYWPGKEYAVSAGTALVVAGFVEEARWLYVVAVRADGRENPAKFPIWVAGVDVPEWGKPRDFTEPAAEAVP